MSDSQKAIRSKVQEAEVRRTVLKTDCQNWNKMKIDGGAMKKREAGR